MHKAIRTVELESNRKYGDPSWKLIPAFTFAGVVSAIFSASIWFSFLIGVKNETTFVILGSISFGLALGAVLWFYGLIQSWKTLTAVVALTVAAHLFELYGELHLPIRLWEYVEIPAVGSIEPRVAITSFAVALILCVAFLMLTTPICKIGWAVPVALACALLTGATIAAVDGTQRGAWFSLWKGNALWLLWQLVLAFFLAIALTLKGATPFFHVRVSQERPHASLKRRIAPFGVLLTYFVAVGIWSHSVLKRDTKTRADLQVSLELEAAKKLAEAPSFEKLSPLTPRPFDQVLVLNNIGEWAPYFHGSYNSPAARTGAATKVPGLPAPERKTYYVRYSKSGNSFAVQANVTVYPNENWARYEAHVPPIARQARGIQLLQRFGNNIYQDGPYFFWSSGDKVVELECQGVLPDVIDEFLKAYLQRFPSSV